MSKMSEGKGTKQRSSRAEQSARHTNGAKDADFIANDLTLGEVAGQTASVRVEVHTGVPVLRALRCQLGTLIWNRRHRYLRFAYLLL